MTQDDNGWTFLGGGYSPLHTRPEGSHWRRRDRFARALWFHCWDCGWDYLTHPGSHRRG